MTPETSRPAWKRRWKRADYDRLRAEQKELREQGVYRGIGISSYIHVSGFGPSPILGYLSYYTGGYEGSTVKIDPNGKATVYTGMIPMGQGTETTLAQVAAHHLEIDMADVRGGVGRHRSDSLHRLRVGRQPLQCRGGGG